MRRPKKTVSINLSDYLSAGTYSVKVKSKGTDIRDSEDSNVESCVVAASGYSGNIIAWNTSSVDGQMSYMGWTTRIKFDTTPTDDDDYDAYIDTNGTLTGATTYSGKTKVYAWVPRLGYLLQAGIKINNNEQVITLFWDSPQEITLTGNYDIYLAGGSGM